jgi:hypothetical protein
MPEQLVIEWDVTSLMPDSVNHALPPPALPILDCEERSALDYALLGMSARPHPMHLRRRELRRRGVYTIAELADVSEGHIVRVAGWCISAQRPPTAKGMGFLVLEDETGRLPVAVPPRLATQLHGVLRDARVVVVMGRVERVRWYRSVLARDLFALTERADEVCWRSVLTVNVSIVCYVRARRAVLIGFCYTRSTLNARLVGIGYRVRWVSIKTTLARIEGKLDTLIPAQATQAEQIKGVQTVIRWQWGVIGGLIIAVASQFVHVRFWCLAILASQISQQ